MTNNQKTELVNLWLKKGCDALRLGGKCYDLHWQYKKSLSGPGCSACRRRKMRAKYAKLFSKLLDGKDYHKIKK